MFYVKKIFLGYPKASCRAGLGEGFARNDEGRRLCFMLRT